MCVCARVLPLGFLPSSVVTGLSTAQPNETVVAGLFPMGGTAVPTGAERAGMARLAALFVNQNSSFNAFISFNMTIHDDGTIYITSSDVMQRCIPLPDPMLT